MSATDLETSPEREYFDAIELHFIALRGAPLTVNAGLDYPVIKTWYEREIPLEVVLRALNELFERRRSRGTTRRVPNVRYCAQAVDRAFAEYASLTHAGRVSEAAPLQVEPRLAALAGSLPPDLPQRAEWAGRIAALAGSASEVEAQLAALDAELLDSLLRTANPELLAEIDQHVEAMTAPLAARVPAAELEATRARLRRRELRGRHGIGVLSLFSPEAEPPSAP